VPSECPGTVSSRYILPKPYFTKLEVEQGGMGAGTIIRIHMRVFGAERILRQRVSEPDPGRILVEQDMELTW
jgi:hypothetical protein